MIPPEDPFSFRSLYNRSLSYGAVVFVALCYNPLRELFVEPVTAERVRETAGALGALLPVVMAVSAVVACMARKVLFRCGGVTRRSLGIIFMLGSFWHLPFTLPAAHAAAPHEPEAWQLPLLFTALGMLAGIPLLCVLRRLPRAR